MDDILRTIYKHDPHRAVRSNRFGSGTVVSVSGGIAELNVGARLPIGTPQNIKLPCAAGFTPSAGQTVAILYPNDSPNSGYVVASGHAAAVVSGAGSHNLDDHTGQLSNARLVAPKAAFCLSFHIGSVGAGAAVGTRQAATKNKTGKVLTVLGVTVFARSRTGTANPTVNVYEAAASILNAAVTLLADGTIYEPTVDDTSIANGAEISVRCTTDADGSISELDVHLWVKAEHIA